MKTLNELLAVFGLDDLERQVYVFLLRRGWSTALQISRGSSVKRTTLYRVLQRLEVRGLVETQLDEKTTYYQAGEPHQFKVEVSRKAEEAKLAQSAYISLEEKLGQLGRIKTGETGVKFYRGVKGLQAMEWRMCEQGNKEVLLFGEGSWYEFLGHEFAEAIRAEMVAKRIRIRELINPEKTEPVGKDGKVGWTTNIEYVKHYFRHRVVKKSRLQIPQDLYVFETTIHLGSYRDDEMMGVEIQSLEYAGMFRQLFELIWAQAEVIDSFGGEF